MLKEKIVLGLSGTSRSGKDTFASILETKLVKAGKSVLRVALAEPLKNQCAPFLKEKFGLDAHAQDTETKTFMRPFFVWYGDAQRKRTNGRYWINLATSVIDSTNRDYYIITDVRYDHYEKDELYWLKTEMRGSLCHISRFAYNEQGMKVYNPPANEHEATNDPKLKISADYMVEWENIPNLSSDELILNDSMNDHVESYMKALNIPAKE